jgi:hypothetical protein
VVPGIGGERPTHVAVMIRATRAHFHGTLRCASWCACPVCSVALRIERSNDVVKCVNWWRDNPDCEVLLLTLTLAHSMGDDLRALNKALQRCWRHLWAGKPGARLKRLLGLDHYIRGADHTHGTNGWHPHFHAVLFVRTIPDAARALSELKARWHSAVLRELGREYAPSWSKGVDLRPAKREGDYLVKLGLELTSSETKTASKGRTPWEIARSAAAGDHDSVVLWDVYVKAMKGVRQLVWSRQLRKLAGVGEELTDEQIVNAEGNDAEEVHVADVPVRVWHEVAHKPGALYAIKLGAETGGRMGVAHAINLYRYGLAPPDPGEPTDQLTLDLFAAMAPVIPASSLAAA